jgi:hypothetical protein
MAEDSSMIQKFCPDTGRTDNVEWMEWMEWTRSSAGFVEWFDLIIIGMVFTAIVLFIHLVYIVCNTRSYSNDDTKKYNDVISYDKWFLGLVWWVDRELIQITHERAVKLYRAAYERIRWLHMVLTFIFKMFLLSIFLIL